MRRVVLTSGKLYYDLLKAREDKRATTWHSCAWSSSTRSRRRRSRACWSATRGRRELVWAQEEPSNMGAWRFVRERFLDGQVLGAGGRQLRYVGRPESASPATGSYKLHLQEQAAIWRTRSA